ncbi:exclusion protein FxsA [Hyphomicrobium methylovorum]|uniref:FxsA family protein n=1 Tax=Hyphomicrobium methylovorum TaxID=84 RepID=UPI0015E736A3|nr:FxsA family protein [Hyphomicrobium methylovorum]MBA2126126.1 exclusion protein FxsA [Hyphomicrobium methylovorum]
MSRALKTAIVLFLCALPLIELALLVRIGQAIGLGWLAVIILGTAFLGAGIIRHVGLSVFERGLSRLGSERESFPPLFDGFLKVLAGLFLIFPGVIADAIGLVLLIPQVRSFVIHTGVLKLVRLFHYQAEAGRGSFRSASRGEPAADADGIVIEGEYERVSERPVGAGRSVQPRRRNG